MEMEVSTVRCFSLSGMYLPREGHLATGHFIADGLKGRPVTMKACDPVSRSYMYADDLVYWLMCLLGAASPACPGGGGPPGAA